MSFVLIALILLVTVFLTILFGLWIAQNKSKKVSLFIPYFIPVGAGMLTCLCLVKFLSLSYRTEKASFFILLGIFIVIFADRWVAPFIFPADEDTIHTHSHSHHGSFFLTPQSACSSIGCIIVCAFFDGMEIPVAFTLDWHTGWLVNLGFLFHTIPEGALAASIGISGGASEKKSRMSVVLVGGAVFLGGLVSLTLGHIVSFYSFILPIASGVLLYTCLSHLLPAALKIQHGLLGFFLGSAFIFALEFLSHGW